MLLSADHSQLILVDYQARLMPAIHDADAVVANALRLAQAARQMGVTTWGTEQQPEKLGENLPALRAACDGTLPKLSFDACTDGLVEWLNPGAANGRRQLVVAGCEAHVCLLQTALGLLDAGFAVWVVADACGSRTARNHALAMARLDRAGAVLVSTEMVGFEWLRRSDAPAFKAWQALIR
jgi:nicotinamidase-related amidase